MVKPANLFRSFSFRKHVENVVGLSCVEAAAAGTETMAADLGKNYYCSAYQVFFEYAYERLIWLFRQIR